MIFEWNGENYTESGTYNYSTLNSLGCDSSATLKLTIHNSSSSFEEVEACEIYEWNGEIYTESGVYTYITPNSEGCDSSAVLNLTIYQSSIYSIQVTACDSYEWNGETIQKWYLYILNTKY